MSGYAEGPRDRYEMLRAGYEKKSDSTCKACGAAIQWWKTKRGKSVPFNQFATDDKHEDAICHWQTCERRHHLDTKPAAPAPVTPTQAFPLAVRRLREAQKARIVVAIYDDGFAWSSIAGLPGDDIRHELINAANTILRELKENAR
jgi:hypothetical protein